MEGEINRPQPPKRDEHGGTDGRRGPKAWAARERWDFARAALAEIESALPALASARFDLRVLKPRADIRSPGTDRAGLIELARTLGDLPEAGLATEDVDPALGRAEFGWIESWPLLSEVLDLLKAGAARSPLARRRWLELAAPSNC